MFLISGSRMHYLVQQTRIARLEDRCLRTLAGTYTDMRTCVCVRVHVCVHMEMLQVEVGGLSFFGNSSDFVF